MVENWYALYICLMKEISIDKSLICMGIRSSSHPSGKQMNPRKSKYSQELVDLVVNLKNKGKSYNEIAIETGLTRGQAWGALKMYGPKKATKNPDQSVQSSMHNNSNSLYHIEGGMQVVSQM